MNIVRLPNKRMYKLVGEYRFLMCLLLCDDEGEDPKMEYPKRRLSNGKKRKKILSMIKNKYKKIKHLSVKCCKCKETVSIIGQSILSKDMPENYFICDYCESPF